MNIMINTLQDHTQPNVRPADTHLNIPIHNPPTVTSLYIQKVIRYIKNCKDTKCTNS